MEGLLKNREIKILLWYLSVKLGRDMMRSDFILGLHDHGMDIQT